MSTESLRTTVYSREGVTVILTEGYINNQGGEAIARLAYEQIDEGNTKLLLNLAGTRIINSIGISILIEIVEKLIAVGGRLAFCSVTSTIEKTFQNMGLTQYATVFPDEDTAVTVLKG